MYPYNRRFYISREPEKKIETNLPEASERTEVNNTNSTDTENIKLLLENVDEIKDSLKKLEENISEIASKLASLENRFDIESIFRNIENNLRNMQIQYNNANSNIQPYTQKHNDCELINSDNELSSYNQTEKSNQTPIMPGTGFSYITAEYLRNLSKNRYNKI